MQSEEQLAGLVAWARDAGFVINDKIEFVTKPNEGSTVVAKEPIDAEELLVKCPEEYIVGPKLADNLADDFAAASPRLQQILIKLAFAREVLRKDDSQWRGYISVLPQRKDLNNPVDYDGDDLKWLEGTNLSHELSVKKRQWEKEFLDAQELACWTYLEEDGCNLEMYTWVSLIFMSRSFPAHIVYANVADTLSVLLPVIDSLNHQPLTAVHWKGSATAFDLSAGKRIEASQEVLNNYGPKGNEELLLGYGFSLKNNPFDILSLRVMLPPVIIDNLRKLKYDVDDSGVFFISRERVPDSLKVAFSMVVSIQHQFPVDAPVTQVRALEILVTSLQAKASQLEKNPGEPSNIRQTFASYYREGQKILYESTIQQCQKELKTLESDPSLKVLDADRLFDLDMAFITLIATQLGAEDVDDILSAGLEDQLILFYLAREVVNGELTVVGDEGTESAGYYDELIEATLPALKEGSAEFASPLWTAQTLALAGQFMEQHGYGWNDASGHERFKCVYRK